MVTKRVSTGKKATRKKTDGAVNHADGAAAPTDGAAAPTDGAAGPTDGAATQTGVSASHNGAAEFAVPESAPPVTAGATDIDPDVRRKMIAAEAYYRAERRGFAAGGELDDWVAAEEAVASRFGQQQVA